ncbi:DUF7344 domain-containing protein [Halogeometricum limi]|nr:hypothetical protein [Halogeometricum limi]
MARIDDRFGAFADATRRRVLRVLCTSSDEASELPLDTLVTKVGESERLGNEDGQLRLHLVHVHLPKLERAALVDYDGETVRLTVETDVVTDGLRLAKRFETG